MDRWVLSEPMCGLSNIFRWRDGHETDGPAVVRPVEHNELEEAVRLLLGTEGNRVSDAVAREFLQLTRSRGIDAKLMRAAFAGNRVAASCLPIISPGKTVLLMTSSSGGSVAVADLIVTCIRSAVAQFDPDDISLAQLLIETSDTQTIDAARQANFSDLATLIYLQRTVGRSAPEPRLPPGCRLLTYSPTAHGHFATAILASYVASLDCPSLHGRREIDDIIAGHKGSGEFVPELWFCLLKNETPSAVLLLAPARSHHTLELVYIGLSPESRGHGIGDYLVDLALHHTHAQHLSALTLAVDSANQPAMRLYFRHGMGEVHRRYAMLKSL